MLFMMILIYLIMNRTYPRQNYPTSKFLLNLFLNVIWLFLEMKADTVQEEVGYQAISEKETADLKALMSGCDSAISAADEFADR